ncbi:MAG TPA: SET domain-containing protein-lysine N-methyltransferase [Burkholderiales bacterium]|nr:SET domain-containing protein-lysine N-methyltransferase [Burkholderiales bacterium]
MARSTTSKSSSVSRTVPYVVRDSKVHGKGVFARRKILAGAKIVEYKGERITWKEAGRRDPHDPDNPYHTFFFSLDNGRVIDGGVGGGPARWINHACDPNCEAIEEDGRVFIYALRDIRRGEELNYDYGLIIDERYTPTLKRAYACWCNASTCRQTMLAPKRKASSKQA